MTEYTGEWWAPSNSDLKTRGTLTIRNFYADLKIIPEKNCYHFFRNLGKNLYNPDILLGFAGGKKITLLKCKRYKTGMGFQIGQSNPSLNVPIYYPSSVFVGTHFAKHEDIHFKSLKVFYQHLNEWTNIFKISAKISNNFDKIVVEYEKPKAIRLYCDKTTSIATDFQPIEACSLNKIGISQKTLIKIEHLQKEELFEKDLSFINWIRNFLAFSMNSPIYPFRINGTTEKEKIILKKDKPPLYPDIKIFIPNMLENIKEDQQLFTEEMLFSLKDISPKIENVIDRWFEIMRSPLKVAFDLYLDTLYNPSSYIRHNFLNLIQAFEVFYNVNYPKEKLIIAEAIYNKIVYKKLMKKFDDIRTKLETEGVNSKKAKELKESIGSKLKYGNEISLRKKIIQVMKDPKYNEVIKELVTKDKEKLKDLAYKIAEIRNKLSHGEEVDKNELIITGKKLDLLVKIILLKTLGFEDEEITNFLHMQT